MEKLEHSRLCGDGAAITITSGLGNIHHDNSAVLVYPSVENPTVILGLGFLLPIILLSGEPIYESVIDAFQQVKEARPASNRVRTALENLGVQRWRDEAPMWGHGKVESGPKLVEFISIGSHHTW